MRDFTSQSNNNIYEKTASVGRRPVLAGFGFGTLDLITGTSGTVTFNQEFADPSGAGDMSFTDDLSIGWVAERFIELDSPEHPAVGTELSCRGVVITELAGETEREAFANDALWHRFAVNGESTLGRFFRPIEQFARSNTTINETAYDQFEIIRVAGIEHSDQRFYDKYDFPPYVWAIVTDRSELSAGTVIEADAVIRHSESLDGYEGFQGPFLEITNTSVEERKRSLKADTTVGDSADFVGLQTLDDPVLSAYTTDVGYSFERNTPVPSAGSLVHHEGSVTEHEFQIGSLPRENTAELETVSQDILVGDQRDASYETVYGDAPETLIPNTVAVIDVSGSMSEADTRTGETRMEVARGSVISLLQLLPDDHNLGIVTFSSNSETIAPMTTVGGQRDQLEQRVAQIETDGQTSIGSGLIEALDLLEGNDYPQSIILLSDGEENTSPYVSDVLPNIIDRGIRVFTIGMGSDINPDLLRNMANETNADVRISPSPEDTRAFFQQLAAGVQRREEFSFAGERLSEGETTGGVTDVDESVQDVQFSLSYPGSLIRLEVQRPDGTVVSEGDPGVEHRVSGSSEVWDIDSPASGEWSYTAIAEELPEPQRATIEVNADTPIQTELFITDDVYEQTGLFKFELKATEDRERYTGAEASLIAQHTESGDTTEISLNDDGTGGDPVSDTGIYTGYFHPEELGEYTFTAVLERGSYEALRREHEETIVVDQVVDEPVRLFEEDGFFSTITFRNIGIIGVILTVFATTIIRVVQLLSDDSET